MTIFRRNGRDLESTGESRPYHSDGALTASDPSSCRERNVRCRPKEIERPSTHRSPRVPDDGRGI